MLWFRSGAALSSAGLAWIAAATLSAQTASLYPFSFDQDRLQGLPDFSFLNHALSASDRVFVRDSHFYMVGPDLLPNTADDQRIRFFGVNLAFGANFPDKQDAPRIAKRLRRLGINLVRLHHMDSTQDPAGSPNNANGILTDGPYPTFNEVSLTRLRDFIAALSAEGIHINLNLHVGYRFRPSVDQVPPVPNQSIPEQSKPVHIFHPRMVDLQKQFTAQLIDKLGLRGNPALAMVEINNESSLIYSWQNGQLDTVLAGEYRTALAEQWNRHLALQYSSTGAIAAAWGANTPDGQNLLNGRWTLEQGHGKTGSLVMTQTDGVPTAEVQPGAGSGWLFLKQTGFHVTAGVRYIWTFEARANLPAGQSVNVPVSFMRDVSPWDGLYYGTIRLTDQWQTFQFAVTPAFSIGDSGRVSLDVEYAPASVYARNMTLVEAGQRGLAPQESLEAANISLIGPAEGATAGRMADYTSFLIATDRAYVNVLRDVVRARTDSLVPVTGTQMGYGGLAILDSQDGLDYQDNHFYIDHYSFPNTAWDGFDWRIRNATAADDSWSSFLDMAWARQAGRPYTVSEFNQPWPNTHAAELDPSFAAFASYQDWDAVIHFAYSHGRTWDSGVPNGFNINGDWTKFAVIGQSAWIFRTGAVKPGLPAAIPVSASERLRGAASGQRPAAWVAGRAGVPKEWGFSRRVELVKDGQQPPPAELQQSAQPPYAADTGELVFDRNRKLLLLRAPAAAGVIGVIGAGASAGPIEVEAPSAAQFATVLVTSPSGTSIPRSASLLVSVPGFAVRAVPDPGNRQPSATNARPQSLVFYPGSSDWWTIDRTNSASSTKPSGDLNGGWQPTFMERVELYLTLRTNASTIVVSALDGAGNPTAQLPASEVQRVAGGFRIHLNGAGQPPSPWFAIAAVQRPAIPAGKPIR